MEGKAGLLHGIRDRHCLEVATMVNLASFALDKRVVSR